MTWRALVGLLLAAVVFAVHAEDRQASLSELGRKLRAAREAPYEPGKLGSCPIQAQLVSGVNRKQVLAALGKPDLSFPIKKPMNSGAIWGYIFESRAAPPMLGGGQAQVTFYFGHRGRVEEVECHLAR